MQNIFCIRCCMTVLSKDLCCFSRFSEKMNFNCLFLRGMKSEKDLQLISLKLMSSLTNKHLKQASLFLPERWWFEMTGCVFAWRLNVFFYVWKQPQVCEFSLYASLILTHSLLFFFYLSPTQAYSSILVVMVILLNIAVAILFIHFFI